MTAGPTTPDVAISQPVYPGLSPRLRVIAIQAEQVRQLYRLSRLGVAGTIACATVVTIALYRVLPAVFIVSWACCIAAACAGHFVLYHAYMKRAPADEQSGRWATYLLWAIGFKGV